MSFRDDERGQAIQVGAVLLFAALIIAFSSYQAFVVPNQNRQVEFNHNQDVQGQLQEVRNAIVSVPGGNTGRSVTVDLGVEYPSRLVALNPGPATGTLRTSGTTDERYNLTIANATATGEVGDFWNGSTHVYNTGGLVYAPGYNRYDQAPQTVYENSVLVNQGRDRSVPITGQQLIEGDQITLVTLNGSLSSTRSGPISADLQALSTSTRTVSVRNDSHNLTLEVPTRLSEDRWENLTDGEDNVEGVEVSEGALDGEWGLLRLDLASDTTYDLRMAKVGVGTGTEGTDGKYLTAVSGNGESLNTGQSQRLVAEIRDDFNNPVSGQEVNASVVDGSGSIEPIDNVTDEDGRVAFRYDAPSGATTARVETSFSPSPSESQRASFEIDVAGAAESGSYGIDWLFSEIESEAGVRSCFQDNRTCIYNVDADDGTLPLTAETTPTVSFASVDFSVNDTNRISDLQPSTSETGPSGVATTDASVEAVGDVTLRATTDAGGDEFTLRIARENPEGLVYNGDGAGVDVDGSGVPAGLRFSVTNNYQQSLRITDLSIDPRQNSIEELDVVDFGIGPWEDELHVDTDLQSGYVDYAGGETIPNSGLTIDLSADGYQTAESVTSASGTATVHLYQFFGTNGAQADMSSSTVEVTVQYRLADGTAGSETFTVSP
ncbi:hypothetical protein BV210_13980 [Halorientalis sp. IM1011]|uniref:hypothetical protein n=1 Tax=Halorientalis sp. IM1011 TaxID=1932360 RepID=UPI00097CCC42|nr:hypothetical protein [Halorientalis sp. IM1011]AQL43745.1 hypothetical protein BV210_13980 [Halorientalis sp. IM1011]